jgi:hypothetical protein
VHRRVFRRVLGRLEDQVLLSGNPTVYMVNLTSDAGTSSGTDTVGGTTYTSGDLLWAMTQADAGSNTSVGVINFRPTTFATPQTTTLGSTLELSEAEGPEAIDATGVAGPIAISGNHQVGIFHVDSGVTATLSGLTIAARSAGSGGGSAFCSGRSMTVNCAHFQRRFVSVRSASMKAK